MTQLLRAPASTPEATIAHGSEVVTHGALQNSLPAWERWLDANHVPAHRCVGLRPDGSVRSAAALIALLSRGQSVLLWRAPITVEDGRLAPDTLPKFCRAALIETAEPGSEAPAPEGPDGFRLVWADPARDDGTAHDSSRAFVYIPTSGTTGRPKMAAFAPSVLLDNARNVIGRLQLDARDRVIIPVPLAHMYGLGAALLPAVLAGASVRLVSNASFISYLSAEAELEPTVAFLTPSFCHQILRGRRRNRPYRLTVLAGDRADPQMFADQEGRHGTTVCLYGSTELGVICAGSPDDPFPARRDTVGTPLPGVRLAPAEGAAPEALRSKEPVALDVQHPYGCAGYADEAGNPQMPPALATGPWYHTRDLARLDGEGRLQLIGRFDHAVKRDGLLVAFSDVENALRRLDAIDTAVVVAGGTTPRGRELVAVCTGRGDDSAALRRAALDHLPGYAVPDRFVFVDELPLTATAKPDRFAIAAIASPPDGEQS